MKTFDQLADDLLNRPEVDPNHSFVQATRHNDVVPLAYIPSSPNRHTRVTRETVYRVHIRLQNGNFGEAEATDMQTAFDQARERARKPLPKIA